MNTDYRTTASRRDAPNSTPGVRVHSSDFFDSILEQRFWTCAAIFLGAFLICAVLTDIRVKMWNDEIFTLYVAQQGSPAAIVRGIRDGMDATPPLYPIIVSVILRFVRHEPLAVRLPSTLGFTAMLVSILAFCRRRMAATYTFLAVILGMLSCGFYATEGRSYGLVLGCAAGALFCWQSLAEDRRRGLSLIGLSSCLVLATALNYYSIFLLLPLGCAELIDWQQERKPDVAMLAAMLFSVVVLGVHYPLIESGRRYLANFWRPGLATWNQIPGYYLNFALAPFAMILVSLVVIAFRPKGRTTDVPDKMLQTREWVLVLTLAATPIVVIVVSRYTTHIFLARYVLWGVIGLAVVGASVLCLCTRGLPVVSTSVVAIFLGVVVFQQVRTLGSEPVLRQGEALFRELRLLPGGPEPIVIAYDHAFIEGTYYAESPLRDRLVYTLDRAVELQYTGSDLDYLLLSGMRAHTNLKIVDLRAFLGSNREFILAARPEDYLARYLTGAGYRITEISANSEAIVYKVAARQ